MNDQLQELIKRWRHEATEAKCQTFYSGSDRNIAQARHQTLWKCADELAALIKSQEEQAALTT